MAVEADPVITFGSELLSRESDISGSGGTKAAEKIFQEKKIAVLADLKAMVREIASALDATQVLLG